MNKRKISLGPTPKQQERAHARLMARVKLNPNFIVDPKTGKVWHRNVLTEVQIAAAIRAMKDQQ